MLLPVPKVGSPSISALQSARRSPPMSGWPGPGWRLPSLRGRHRLLPRPPPFPAPHGFIRLRGPPCDAFFHPPDTPGAVRLSGNGLGCPPILSPRLTQLVPLCPSRGFLRGPWPSPPSIVRIFFLFFPGEVVLLLTWPKPPHAWSHSRCSFLRSLFRVYCPVPPHSAPRRTTHPLTSPLSLLPPGVYR